MKKFLMFKLIVIIFIFLFANQGMTQEKERLYRFAFGMDAGYFLPYGDWQKHRFASGVNQFQGGVTFNPIVEVNLLGVYFGFFYNYSRLSVKDWEQYARSKGDILTASAKAEQLGLLIKYYFVNRNPNWFNFQIGLGYIDLKGTESFAGYTYDYDFLNSGAVYIIGFGYDRPLNERMILTLNAKMNWFPEGVKYPEKGNFDVIGFPITLGIRITL